MKGGQVRGGGARYIKPQDASTCRARHHESALLVRAVVFPARAFGRRWPLSVTRYRLSTKLEASLCPSWPICCCAAGASARSGRTAPLEPNGAFMLGGEQVRCACRTLIGGELPSGVAIRVGCGGWYRGDWSFPPRIGSKYGKYIASHFGWEPRCRHNELEYGRLGVMSAALTRARTAMCTWFDAR